MEPRQRRDGHDAVLVVEAAAGVREDVRPVAEVPHVLNHEEIRAIVLIIV